MKKVSELLAENSYSQLLKSEEWKTFASQTRQRQSFCECCKRKNVELQVHHISYEAGRKPWEYRNDEVVVLCRACHFALHDELKNFRRYVFKKLNSNSLRVINAALGVGLEHNDPLELAYAIASMASSPRSVKLFCNDWINSQKKISEGKIVEPKPEEPPVEMAATP